MTQTSVKMPTRCENYTREIQWFLKHNSLHTYQGRVHVRLWLILYEKATCYGITEEEFTIFKRISLFSRKWGYFKRGFQLGKGCSQGRGDRRTWEVSALVWMGYSEPGFESCRYSDVAGHGELSSSEQALPCRSLENKMHENWWSLAREGWTQNTEFWALERRRGNCFLEQVSLDVAWVSLEKKRQQTVRNIPSCRHALDVASCSVAGWMNEWLNTAG